MNNPPLHPECAREPSPPHWPQNQSTMLRVSVLHSLTSCQAGPVRAASWCSLLQQLDENQSPTFSKIDYCTVRVERFVWPVPNARPQSYFYLLGLGWGLNGVMCGDLLSASRWLIFYLRIIPATANSRESDSQLALQTQGKACSVNLLGPTERLRSTSSSQPPCSFRVCSSPLPASAPRRLPQISISLPPLSLLQESSISLFACLLPSLFTCLWPFSSLVRDLPPAIVSLVPSNSSTP